jgi:hypothetical protein
MSDVFNNSIEVNPICAISTTAIADEESRKNQALTGLAELITVTSGEYVTLERDNESAKLCINGELLEQFSIWGDSPLAVLFDAMQAVMRHKGRIL